MNLRKRKKFSRRLFEAILSGDTVGVKTALRAGADPERGNDYGTTPLYLASVNGQAATARLLLAAGARPDTESSGIGSEGTPLCAAACWGHTEAVRVLLAHGADPDLREDHGTGRSPLDWANDGPHPETAALLVAARAHDIVANRHTSTAPTTNSNGIANQNDPCIH
ncbi:ankyrin repeat domain-containing protein [Streptomyces sp. AV19]|uniref:ankyrin repeat domain-containing protein n=1 Tax=Streptomyces sp. AV19 TaxID=2793068 RepID=UPI0018FE9056|nr:ankyrin repeat domain-containing protein [Streptomyces sp. AV19]MBH1936607.1 ankyrin repeat domain-containing protein [Streptomyces sp. AV19]MDG4532669.1 ankyrin repeat domain-containing protein [Streptomyces sp. AV19]